MTTSARRLAVRLVVSLLALGLGWGLAPADASRAPGQDAPRVAKKHYVPPVKHVFVINIENKGYTEAWGATSPAPYLARHLRRQGVLLTYYYGTAHNSLPNYIAQISGQAPNPQTQADCQTFSPFVGSGRRQAPQQEVGQGCVYPKNVRTLPRQMTRAGLRWKGYMQQMRKPCQHPTIGQVDPTQQATATQNYAARHNPFVYFRSIIDGNNYCARHVLPLWHLKRDLRAKRTTPNLAYITPDLCADGHDNPCANGDPGGLVKVDQFLKVWVPRILHSAAFKKNGMLVITADESDGITTDSTACCGEVPGPNTPQAGILGPGGGVVGALVISRWTKPNTWSTTPYNHYSLLASLEEIFRLKRIGMAKQAGLSRFGLDVYNTNWWTP